MRSVEIKVLNSRLSEHVMLVASGESILVAELGPHREKGCLAVAGAFLADAVRSGVLAPPRLVGSGPLPVAALDEIRRDRWRAASIKGQIRVCRAQN